MYFCYFPFYIQLSVASLLFVDNPVGAGFSYVDSEEAFTKDVQMIAEDLLTLLTTFFMESKGGTALQVSQL